jgi:putative membrane protein
MVSVFLRGVAMGAADIVPGVSGGTIAFITGIYFRLLQAINAVPSAFVRQLCRGRPGLFWQAVDGTFLLSLLSGILASVLTLASAISYALEHYPIIVWSFFFGLILASVWHVGRQVKHYRLSLLAPLVAGAAVAWWITTLSAGAITPSGAAFFGAGALAICAMILPGISGSFILVIIGMYGPVLGAIKSLDLGILLFFVAGCVLGLLSVARLITWAFHRFHDLVLAVLTGFMIGALNKVWPWKAVLSWRTNSSGEQVPLNELSITPFSYADLTGHDPQILAAIGMAIAGFGIVLLIEWAAKVLPNAQKGCSDK